MSEETKYIRYLVPWNDENVLSSIKVDMIFSMDVLEHIDDLKATYESMHQLLSIGGLMSHEVDFKCHGHSRKWNGHWACQDLVWKIIRGRRPYLLNRVAHSEHLQMQRGMGFKVLLDMPKIRESEIARSELNSRFSHFSDDDIRTHAAFIQSLRL